MNKSSIFYKSIAATTFATVAIFSLSSCGEKQNFQAEDSATQVSVEEVKLNSIKKLVSTYGSALPVKSVKINSEIAGKYKLNINPYTGKKYKLGDKVKKGAVIVTLEDQYYLNQTGAPIKKLNYELAIQEQKKQKALYAKGGITLNDMKQSEVKVANAKSDFANAEINLEKMKVVAPFEGVISELPYYTENVKILQNKPIVELMDYSNMYIECNLPESSINEVKVEQPVYYTHYTLENDSLDGTLTEISPVVSMETRTFTSKLVINNNKLLLRPGMFVKADICVEIANDAVVIDKDLVQTWRHRKFVYVAKKNIAKFTTVETGIENDEKIEITDGLEKGDLLIVRGYETLRDNTSIKINR